MALQGRWVAFTSGGYQENCRPMPRQVLNVTVLAVLALSGCAGLNERIAANERSEAASACSTSGWPVTHTQHKECIANTIAIWRRQGQIEAQQTLGVGVLVAGAIGASRANRAQSRPVGVQDLRQCPDGSVIFGEFCHRAPDGSFHASEPTRAPDGTYVVGEPQRTPLGTYVGGHGNVIRCPDGSYVAGFSCFRTSKGQYIGTPR